MSPRRIRVVYHRDQVTYRVEPGEEFPDPLLVTWWAESPDVDGWHAVGNTLGEVRALVREGLPFFLGEKVVIEETNAGRVEVETRQPLDLDSLLDCVREDLHPDQVRSLIRQAYDTGQQRTKTRLRLVGRTTDPRGYPMMKLLLDDQEWGYVIATDDRGFDVLAHALAGVDRADASEEN